MAINWKAAVPPEYLPRYKIVSHKYTQDLSDEVIAAIEQGYVPQGGPFTVSTNGVLKFAQALYLPEPVFAP